jgi:lipopolysaccharide export system ATP-binding protein
MLHQLEVDSVVKHFDDNPLLSDVYLSCFTNDIIGIFGSNGTGKSTLMEIIFGTVKAENKFIRIDKIKVEKPFTSRDAITYLPQKSFIPKYLTVKKSSSLFLNNAAIASFYNDTIIQSIKDQKIKQLSFGELRYLEIKLILDSNSKFCLLDEPFQGLSPIFIDKIKKLIIKSSLKKGIIITDHDYSNVLEIITKMYVLKDRSLISLKDKSQLVDYGYLGERGF